MQRSDSTANLKGVPPSLVLRLMILTVTGAISGICYGVLAALMLDAGWWVVAFVMATCTVLGGLFGLILGPQDAQHGPRAANQRPVALSTTTPVRTRIFRSPMSDTDAPYSASTETRSS